MALTNHLLIPERHRDPKWFPEECDFLSLVGCVVVSTPKMVLLAGSCISDSCVWFDSLERQDRTLVQRRIPKANEIQAETLIQHARRGESKELLGYTEVSRPRCNEEGGGPSQL